MVTTLFHTWYFEYRNVFSQTCGILPLFCHLKKKKKKKMVLQTALLFISDCHPSAPLGALPKALLCVWCTACGSLLWDPGLYIWPLGALCVQSFHSTSERFPQYKALLFSSSPATAKTTVWFLDGTEYAQGSLTLSKRLGERSCKPRPRSGLCLSIVVVLTYGGVRTSGWESGQKENLGYE